MDAIWLIITIVLGVIGFVVSLGAIAIALVLLIFIWIIIRTFWG